MITNRPKIPSLIIIIKILLVSPVFGQNYDSCRIYALDFWVESPKKIPVDFVLTGTNDTSFLINKDVTHSISGLLQSTQNNLKNSFQKREKMNRYSLDCRLVFLFYRNAKCDTICVSNGFIAFNDDVYSCDNSLLTQIFAIVPSLDRILRYKEPKRSGG